MYLVLNSILLKKLFLLRCHHSFSPFMSKQSTKVRTASRDFLSLQNTANYLFAKSMWWMMLLASEASTSLSTIFSKFLSHHLRNGSKTSASHDRRAHFQGQQCETDSLWWDFYCSEWDWRTLVFDDLTWSRSVNCFVFLQN